MLDSRFITTVSVVALASSAWAQYTPVPPGDPRPVLPAQVVSAVEPESCGGDLATLVGFGTRHSLSDTKSRQRGVGAARDWLAEQMRAADQGRGLFEVRIEEVVVPPGPRMPGGGTLYNVVGVLKGTMYPDRRYYVVGHYDSRNGDANDASGDAPGANDDGSGTVVVVQLARALASRPLESTVVFLCTSGEEQGLYGARFHADQAKTRGEQIVAVLSNDIVGDPLGDLVQSRGPRRPADDLNLDKLLGPALGIPDPQTTIIRVFSEGLPQTMSAEKYAEARKLAAESDSPSRQLARYVADAARRERTVIQPKLIFRSDRFLRGGDHSAFLDNGFPAVRFTVPREEFTRQHQNVRVETRADGTAQSIGDTIEFVDFVYLANVAKLNGVTLVHLANAPSTPQRVRVVTEKLTNDTTLRWEPSPERDVAGYEVVWRETTAADWQESRRVGKVGEVTLPVSKDDYFFGVRAFDNDGYRSPVGFAGAAAK